MKTTHKNKTRFRCDYCKKLIPERHGVYLNWLIDGHYCSYAHADKKYHQIMQPMFDFESNQSTGNVIPVKNQESDK
jgi:hypothetical protein